MAYATTSDVQSAVGGEANLIALTDPENTGVVDDVLVADAIVEADALINTYASKRYAVPFATASVAIRKLAARMAGRILRRDRGQVLMSDVTDEEIDRKWLEALAAGKVTPGTEPIEQQSALVVDKVGPRESTKNVSREKTKGFW